ncbi:MAG TPA: periplasmic heavy metal sensor [Thermoanaerobaculia bacterium]
MKKTCLAVVSLITLMMLHPAIARADAGELPPPIAFVSSFLQLSEAQTASLIGMIQSRDAAIRPIAEALQAKQQALQGLLDTPNPDATAVGTLMVEINTGQHQIAAIAQSAAASFAATLTDEQKQRMNFVHQAVQVAPIIPAFKAVGL